MVDSVLQMTVGENLVVTYTDAEDNLDTISSLLDPFSAINLVLGTGEVSPTSADPIVVTATFSSNVTGFTIEDVSVVNGTASNLIVVAVAIRLLYRLLLWFDSDLYCSRRSVRRNRSFLVRFFESGQ